MASAKQVLNQSSIVKL